MNKDIFVCIEHLHGQVSDISYMMLAAGRNVADNSGGEVVALLLGHNQEQLANDMAADKVWYTDHPALEDFTSDIYLDVLANQIRSANPLLVLFGHSSIGMDLASGLSARLELPIVSQCQKLAFDNGSLRFTSQICGGKMMAEGNVPQPSALLTMVPGDLSPDQGRTDIVPEIIQQMAPEFKDRSIKLLEYLEPESGDIDITKEPILIAVGRGLQNRDDLELVEELAESMGGVVCGSRPIVDQGWLPTSRLIGKSGRIVKPQLYLAMGISGAPEHVEGCAGSDLIIAINTDPNAPIYDVAHFGADIDMLDLVEELSDQLELSLVG